MRDKSLVTADDPGEIADTSRFPGLKGECDREPRRIAECLGPGSPQL
jgi:hypothetical protein